jgi:hypothetical protein
MNEVRRCRYEVINMKVLYIMAVGCVFFLLVRDLDQVQEDIKYRKCRSIIKICLCASFCSVIWDLCTKIVSIMSKSS